MTSFSYHDLKNPKLLPLVENKTCAPLEKRLRLTRQPYVSTIANGELAGCFCSTLDFSFSPINYPLSDPQSQTDSDKFTYRVEELKNWVENHQPMIVYLKGGDVFYKWEDIRDLVSVIDQKYIKVIEVPGCTIPPKLSDLDFQYKVDLIRIRVPYYKSVVKDGEYIFFLTYLKDTINKFLNLNKNIELIFDYRDYKHQDKIDEFILHNFTFLNDIENSASIIFSFDDQTELKIGRSIADQYIINKPTVKLQLNLGD